MQTGRSASLERVLRWRKWRRIGQRRQAAPAGANPATRHTPLGAPSRAMATATTPSDSGRCPWTVKPENPRQTGLFCVSRARYPTLSAKNLVGVLRNLTRFLRNLLRVVRNLARVLRNLARVVRNLVRFPRNLTRVPRNLSRFPRTPVGVAQPSRLRVKAASRRANPRAHGAGHPVNSPARTPALRPPWPGLQSKLRSRARLEFRL